MRIFIGIDPGAKGGGVAIEETGVFLERFPFVSFHDAASRIDWLWGQREIALVCLEKVQAMPGQGRTSMFSFGANFGFWIGVLEARRIAYELIIPQKWQKEVLDCKPGKGETKDHVFNWACRRWPGVSFVTEKGRRQYEYTDAIGLAEYARRRINGGGTK
jgi:crossover junction endodeoxyribonuclease RuvC